MNNQINLYLNFNTRNDEAYKLNLNYEKDEMIFSELRKSIVKLAKSDKNIIVGNEIE